MYLNSETSKYILNCIVNNNKIDFKNKDVSKYKKEIKKLKIDYNNFPKTKSLSSYKYYIFLELIKKKYNIQNLKLKKRNQKKKCSKNVTLNVFFCRSDRGERIFATLRCLLFLSSRSKDPHTNARILC